MRPARRTVTAGFVAVIGVAAWAVVTGAQEPGAPITFLGAPVTPAQIAGGQEIYAANCATCHGAKLEGEPDWKRRREDGRMPAPPHDDTGHTWHHSDRQLFTITKRGVSAIVPGYDSNMPAFEGALTDAEIVAVLAYIKSTWPERERSFQAEVTANDEG
jgi:mono/diheme cytochrome c family protein